MKNERTFTPYQVTYMMELVFIVEQFNDIKWNSVDERYEATEKMYDKAQKIFESEEGECFAYEGELYQDVMMELIVNEVLNELEIEFTKIKEYEDVNS